MNTSNDIPVLVSGLALDPTELLLAMRRRKWFILLMTLVCGLVVTGATMRQPKIYQARAQILIEPMLPKVLGEDVGIDDLKAQTRSELAFYNTQHKTMTSRAVVSDVLQRLRLDEDPSFLSARGLPTSSTRRQVEDALLSLVRVEPERHSRIVYLIVEDLDADRAALIANTFGQAYIDYSLEVRLENNRTASTWLDERVVEFQGQLEEHEKNLYHFKERNTLVSVSLEDRQNMTSASLSILNEKLLETKARLIGLRSRQKTIDELLAEGQSAVAIVQKLERNEVVTELRGSLEKLERERAELLVRYGPKHPVMVALEERRVRNQQSLESEVQLVLSGVKDEMAALENEERQLMKAMRDEKQKALELNSMGLEYSKLTRDLGTTKEMYESLLKRQTEASLSGLLKSNFVRWFERAEPKHTPVRPLVLRNAGFGFGIGLILGMVAIFASVILDNTVHNRADIEDLVGLPFLGIFPRILGEDSAGPASRDLFVLQNPKSGAAECARSVRTNLVFMATDKPLRKLLLTSARPGEGKTTTVAALGIAMAQAGNRVIILDTDLRKPRLHRAFGVSGEKGLTSILVGEEMEACIKSTELVSLHVLPCGPLAPNPAELLHSEKFHKLLAELDKRYDRILLDSPPIGVVTDAAILSKVADGTVFVVQASSTPKDAIRRSVRQLADVGANVLGVILNDFEIEGKGSGGYSDYYYYQYYRGYGEGDDDVQAKV
ncbi:MAG: polysaccharide biosynthesis tyrosine autokinase [Myxococcales bacterium]|nr:polysaccharide biosynthesis tyrosine autokinase [Myxococcales bacterium]